MSEMDEEFGGGIYTGEPDDVVRFKDGKQDDMEDDDDSA